VSEVIELTMPVDPDLLMVVRFTAAAIAARADFAVEEIEDLRLAVDELCVSLIRGREGGRLALCFTRDDAQIDVTCRFVANASEPPRPEDVDELSLTLSLQIIDALVDEHGRGGPDDPETSWLRKRRAHTSA
jgi:serine/threonine-protein kinase RsbW